MKKSVGVDVISLGFNLCKKPNKTEFEEQAAIAFKKSMWSTVRYCVFVFILLNFLIVNFIFSLPSYSARRVGTVEGYSVRYVQDTMKYVSLIDLGLDPSDVEEGEKINLYFDRQDNLITGKLESDSDTEIMLIVVGIFGSCAVGILRSLMLRKGKCKAWYQYVREHEELIFG